MQENQIHIGRPKLMPGFQGLGRRIDQSQADHFHPGTLQAFGHHTEITLQPRFKPGELRPVCVQTDAEKAHTQRVIDFSHMYRSILAKIATVRQFPIRKT